AIIAGLFRVKNRRGGIYDWANIDWARDILRAAGTPVAAEGLEHIPPSQPLMYASNHSSMFDIWALFATLPGSVRFVAKQELFRIPLLGAAMRAAGHIAIDRAVKARAFEAYDDAARTIRRGFSAVVFPEGTRSRTGELLPFKHAPCARARFSTAGATPRSRPTSRCRAAQRVARPYRAGRRRASVRRSSCATAIRSVSAAKASSRR